MDCAYNPPMFEDREDFLNEASYDTEGFLVPTKVRFLDYAPEWSHIEMYYTLDDAEKSSSRWTEDNQANINEMHYGLVGPLSRFLRTINYYSMAIGDSGYGRVDALGHIGIKRFVDGDPSYHFIWKAIDISYLHWEGGNVSRPHKSSQEVTTAGSGSIESHRRLIAVEACLRSAFGYVLNRYIGNPKKGTEGRSSPHANHFHADDGCPVALITDRARLESPPLRKRTVRSCHYFVQDCINAFTDRQIDYDGRWGTDTEDGYLSLLSDLGMEHLDPIHRLSHFRLFLAYIIMHGIGNRRAGFFRYSGTFY